MITRAHIQVWGMKLARPVIAGALLLAVESALVVGIGGDLFLGVGEFGRYFAAALPLIVAVCVTLWALASAVLRLSGAAGRIPQGAPIGPGARRAGAAAAAVFGPAAAIALWALTEGRRFRDLPLRPFLVLLGGLSVAFVLFWVIARVVRKARAADIRELRIVAAFSAGVALAALVADATILRRLYPSLHWTLAALSLSAALFAVASWPVRIRAGRAVSAFVLLCFIATPLSLWLLRDASNAAFVVERSAPITGKVVRSLRSGGDRLRRVGGGADLATPAPSQGIDLLDRDVLLITVDALRADRLAAMGGSGVAPNIDALADGGAVFTRAYTTTPETSYAIGSLFTGKYLRSVMELPDAPQDHVTLAELLARNGYQTAAFHPPAIAFVDEERFERFEDRAWGFSHREAGFVGADGRVAQITAWLQRAEPDDPVFVWAHFFEPHEPYDPPDGVERGASVAQRYDAEVAAADRAIGELVATFRRERPGAAIVLTADHGEELGDHGGHYHGTTLYDEQVRVPLIWSAPGVISPAVYETPVDLPDVATTLLSALGVPRNERMRGDDLGPVLAGHHDLGPSHAFAGLADEYMVTDGRLKAICAMGDASCRLYDLTRDPRERRNIGPEREADVARLRGVLSQHLSSIPAGELGAAEEGGAALARAEIGDPTVGPELVPLLGSEDPARRAAAARALARVGYLPALTVLARARDEDEDATVRAEAAVASLRLGDEEALGAVRALAGNPEDGSAVARRAAIALGERGDATGVPLLIALASDPAAEEMRRADAIELLGELAARPAVPALVPLLADLRLRILAAEALGRIGDRRAVRPLLEALDREPYIPARVAEAEALVRLSERRAVPLIRRYLGAPSPLPSGVAHLLALGALRTPSGEGADLRAARRPREGEWTCDETGCIPGEGAVIALSSGRAPRGDARAVLRVLAGEDGDAIIVQGQRRTLRRGAQEIAFDAPEAPQNRRRFEVATEGDVRVVAIAVVPPFEEASTGE